MITVTIPTTPLRNLVLAVGTHSRVHRSFSSRGSQVDSLAAEAVVEAVVVAVGSISSGVHSSYLDCHQCGDLLLERERVEEFARSVDFYSHMLSPCPMPEDVLLLPTKIYIRLLLSLACSGQPSRRYRLSATVYSFGPFPVLRSPYQCPHRKFVLRFGISLYSEISLVSKLQSFPAMESVRPFFRL